MIKVQFIFLFISCLLKAQADLELRYEDKIRISEAFKIAALYGNKIWEDWDKAPFAVLLVYDEYEFLIHHPYPSGDFKLTGFDSLLNGNVFVRKRMFDKNLLAAFPAVNGYQTIVVGTPENTGKSSPEWIISILHEHFHQFQYYQKDYYEDVNDLKLAGSDESGMWMLNYDFPYEDEKINERYNILKNALLKLLNPLPQDSRLFNRDLAHYLEERKKFMNVLNGDDYKYLSFQLWQEGIARYTEYKIADALSDYMPSEELQTLTDFEPFYKTADKLRENIFNQLEEMKLKDFKRECFYPFGAAEGLLLDRINKDWKENYMKEKFFLEKYFPD